jgi:hypothetical protein
MHRYRNTMIRCKISHSITRNLTKNRAIRMIWKNIWASECNIITMMMMIILFVANENPFYWIIDFPIKHPIKICV